MGARPVFADIEEATLGLDPADVERRLTPRTRVLLPVHYAGLAPDMDVLLELARRRGLLLLEDAAQAFGAGYRGRPLATLQGLDEDGRVVYVGSFSKVMFPSLRVAYLVVPPGLVDAFRRARSALEDHPSSVVQPALARFLDEGHFATHLGRMRRLYAARQAALLEASARHLDGLLDVAPDPPPDDPYGDGGGSSDGDPK